MNVKNFMRRARGFMLAALLLPGLVLLSGATAQARGRWHGGRTVVIAPRFGVGGSWYGPRWYGYPYYRNGYSEFVFSNSAAAESQGYHDGLKTGSGDAKDHRSFDPERSHFYTDAGFGNFAEAYRQGFMNGYNAGFRS
jgi:hypothetical protein